MAWGGAVMSSNAGKEEGGSVKASGGVKAMLAQLNSKYSDSHVQLPDGTVPTTRVNIGGGKKKGYESGGTQKGQGSPDGGDAGGGGAGEGEGGVKARLAAIAATHKDSFVRLPDGTVPPKKKWEAPKQPAHNNYNSGGEARGGAPVLEQEESSANTDYATPSAPADLGLQMEGSQEVAYPYPSQGGDQANALAGAPKPRPAPVLSAPRQTGGIVSYPSDSRGGSSADSSTSTLVQQQYNNQAPAATPQQQQQQHQQPQGLQHQHIVVDAPRPPQQQQQQGGIAKFPPQQYEQQGQPLPAAPQLIQSAAQIAAAMAAQRGGFLKGPPGQMPIPASRAQMAYGSEGYGMPQQRMPYGSVTSVNPYASGQWGPDRPSSSGSASQQSLGSHQGGLPPMQHGQHGGVADYTTVQLPKQESAQQQLQQLQQKQQQPSQHMMPQGGSTQVPRRPSTHLTATPPVHTSTTPDAPVAYRSPHSALCLDPPWLPIA